MQIMEILPGSENYQAKVIRIENYRKHPDAKALWIVTVDNANVITGVEPKIGDLHVYFPVLSQIEHNFLSYINGYSNSDLNEDKTVKGFFSDKGRVKPIKLRGLPSEGYLHPAVSVMEYLLRETGFYHDLRVGDEFNVIDGITLCQKYVVPGKGNGGNGGQKSGQGESPASRIVDGQFAFHNSTENLRKNIHKISPDDMIAISYKLHGSSLVVGNLLVKKKLNWLSRVVKKFGVPVQEQAYDTVISSRKVIKEAGSGPGYYKKDIWTEAADQVKAFIPKGYTLYCEIVGFVGEGESHIQKGYDYGVQPGEKAVFVYKITQTNADGFVITLSPYQVAQFCEKYGLRYKEILFYYGYAGDLFPEIPVESLDWNVQFLERLEKEYTEKDCYMCVNKVPEEGIVLVKEDLFGFNALKLKSFSFLQYEDKQLENNESNIEDDQTSDIEA